MGNRRYIITKTFRFDSAHQLFKMPADHPCHQLHGHTYTVDVTLSSLGLDDRDMVLDLNVFRELKSVLDHANLNDVIPSEYGQPTSEVLCKYIWDWIDRQIWERLGPEGRKEVAIGRVGVQETPNNRTELVLEVE